MPRGEESDPALFIGIRPAIIASREPRFNRLPDRRCGPRIPGPGATITRVVPETIGYVALGSNVGDRRANLELGLAGMVERSLVPTRRSSIWASEPVGASTPEWFFNMVVQIRSPRTALEVLDVLLDIERAAGRIRTAVRNAPRTLDLDLLVLGDATVASERLTLPHPRMWQRRFVLAPLAEIDPDVVNPGTGKTVLQSLRELDDAFEVRRLPGAVAAPAARPL